MKIALTGAIVSFLLSISVLGVMIWDAQENSHDMMIESEALESFLDDQRDANRSSFYQLSTDSTN